MLHGLGSSRGSRAGQLSVCPQHSDKENSGKKVPKGKVFGGDQRITKSRTKYAARSNTSKIEKDVRASVLRKGPQKNTTCELLQEKGSQMDSKSLKSKEQRKAVKQRRVSMAPECDLRVSFTSRPSCEQECRLKPKKSISKPVKPADFLLEGNISFPDSLNRLDSIKKRKPKSKKGFTRRNSLHLSPLPSEVLNFDVECGPPSPLKWNSELSFSPKVKLDHKVILKSYNQPCDTHFLSDSDFSCEETPIAKHRIYSHLPRGNTDDIGDSGASVFDKDVPLPFEELFSPA